MWRYLVVGVLIVGAASTSYFAWALHRISGAAIMSDDWPRPAPYPDSWLLALNDWYDARYPVEPGYIKLHGEIARVRLTILACIGASLVLVSIGLWPIERLMLPGRS